MEIELTTPKQKGALIFFYGDERRFREIDYRFDLSLEDHQKMLERGIQQDRIVDILRYLRSNSKYQYSTLNINGFTGTLAPPKSLYARWCYSDGEAVEWEYFWEWYPSEETKALILDPHSAFASSFNREIKPIPIYQLAGMAPPDAVWLFTSEDKDEC